MAITNSQDLAIGNSAAPPPLKAPDPFDQEESDPELDSAIQPAPAPTAVPKPAAPAAPPAPPKHSRDLIRRALAAKAAAKRHRVAVTESTRTRTESLGSSHLRSIDGMPHGDCFVVVNFRGQCWDGARWVALWSDGVQFRRPAPAYELCEQATHEAEHATGIAATVCYIPHGTPTSHVLFPFPDFSQVDLRDLALKPEVC